MRKRRFIIVLLALLCLPAFAVFNGKDLGNTLSVLRYELRQEYDRMNSAGNEMKALDEAQHQQMVDMIKKCDELSLMLYSQNGNYTFDMAYALKEVSREYELVNSGKLPYDRILAEIDDEIDRYSRLLESLRRLPAPGDTPPPLPDSLRADSLHSRPVPPPIPEVIDSLDTVSRKQAFLLDDDSRDDRDACIYYTEALLGIYNAGKEMILTDSQHYESASARLNESYEYAQNRYRAIQKSMFTRGQEHYLEILKHPGKYFRQAMHEIRAKYNSGAGVRSEWRGPILFFWMLLAIFLSMFIRLKPARFKYGLRLYLPVVLVGFVAIFFKMMSVPNTLMNILLPPLLVICMLWQARACRRNAKKAELTDEIVAYVSLVVLVVSSVASCLGFIFLSLLIVMWWLFALALEETIIALYRIFRNVKERRIGERLEELRMKAAADFRKVRKGEFIRLTWLYDFVESVLLPVLVVASLPLSVLLALQTFDMKEIFNNIYSADFFSYTSTSGVEILKLSASMIVLAICLYFVFKYIAYFAKSMARDIKARNIMQASGRTSIKDEEVNLTVANNLISILVWGTFIILLFLLFNIPTGAISIVFAGLATGIGLAMRDVLNNFIYGIQLMSGRLRVGDWVECDGVRGKVSSVSYQSTQIETLDGAVISFLNAALFNKNFKNLTRSNPYEFTKIVVGVKYGTDIEKARRVLLEAMKPLQDTDETGMKIVDEKTGVYVTVEEFSDSSVDIAVKQFVLVPQRNGYLARARETIYKALNEAGIEIPFPQRDVHIINN